MVLIGSVGKETTRGLRGVVFYGSMATIQPRALVRGHAFNCLLVHKQREVKLWMFEIFWEAF